MTETERALLELRNRIAELENRLLEGKHIHLLPISSTTSEIINKLNEVINFININLRK